MKKDVYFQEHLADMQADLAALMSVPSISEDIEETKRALAQTLAIAERMGFDVRSVLDGTVGIVELGEGDETLGILTHVDVVPPGDLAMWESEPFVMACRNDRMYGRGVLDDKGPLISCLYAMKYLKDLGTPLYKKIQLIIGTQEEVEWTDMDQYVKQFSLPDYGFTPDGEFPICNVEKGDGYFVYHFPLGAEGIGCGNDDSLNYIKSIDAGVAENAIPDKCTVVVVRDGKEETLVFEGKAAHSSTPDQGDNAIVKACRALVSDAIKTPWAGNALFEAVETVNGCFADVDCGQIGLFTASQYLNGEFIHKNIVMPTLMETSEDEVKLTVNIRSAFGEKDETVIAAFEGVCEGRSCKLEIKEYQAPIYISRESHFLRTLNEAYEKYSGFAGDFTIEYGGTYAKAIPNVVNWGPVFPGQFYSGHEANESLSVSDFLKAACIYAEALEMIAGSKANFKTFESDF